MKKHFTTWFVPVERNDSKMKLKNNKGFTGIDISVSIIIILIFIPTVFSLVYEIQLARVNVERKRQAIEIATEIFETAKGMNFDDLYTYNIGGGDTPLKQTLTSKGYIQTSTNLSNPVSFSYTGVNDVQYSIKISINMYEKPNRESNLNAMKLVQLEIKYPIGKKENSINISTLVKRM